MARLYIVSTPIGNLSDITYRAVEVLRSVSRILAEDTRRTSILCQKHGIDTPLVSAHEHNEAARSVRVVEWLDDGEDLALVTDAGEAPDGKSEAQRRVGGLKVVPYDLPTGTVVGYFPELTPLVPLWYHDKLSLTPASKGIPVRIERG